MTVTWLMKGMPIANRSPAELAMANEETNTPIIA